MVIFNQPIIKNVNYFLRIIALSLIFLCLSLPSSAQTGIENQTTNLVSSLPKRNFTTHDQPQINISKNDTFTFSKLIKNIFSPDNQPIIDKTTILIKDPNGQPVDQDHIELIQSSTDQIEVSIKPEELIPGKYQIEIVDNTTNEKIYQNFTWGVLTINSDKSLYKVNDTAQLSIAVLDDTGDMVCDAQLSLQITSPDQTTTTLSSTNGQIITNPQCYSKQVSLEPDYQASYQVTAPGIYRTTLTATTSNGVYTIQDSFSADNQPQFNIQRLSPTRIFPVQQYPSQINFSTTSDFSGYLVESAPQNFALSTNNATVETKDNQKLIYWPINIKAGENISLNYNFDAPDISPELFRLGPIQILDINKNLIYQESRLWQIASDAIPGSNSFTTPGTTNWTVPANVFSITIEAWGGGGGGGRRTTNGRSGGGGGGAYAKLNTYSVTPGSSISVTVGAGGTSNQDGGDSYVVNTSTILAVGGGGGTNNSTAAGAGGLASASVGDTKFSGGDGVNGSTSGGGGGGGGAGSSQDGSVGSLMTGGIGGTLGGGNGGDGVNANGAGNPGSANGGGGGGCRRTGGTQLGGDGADGQVYITYLINEAPNTPTNASPTNGGANVSQNPTLTSPSFSDPDSGDTHQNSQWQIATDSGFTAIVWDSGTSTNLTSILVNTTNGTFQGTLSGQTSLLVGATYYWRVRHQDNRNNWSSYSTGTSFTTYSPPPPNPNLKFSGMKFSGMSFR